MMEVDQPKASSVLDAPDAGWQESLSTDETGSEDFFDNHSVVSDAVSQLSSRSYKRHDLKKIMGTIQRLKQENLSLRDALESTNMLDLAILKNKLRGANADLIRVRQTNAELKDRVQVLEKKIFEMVTTSREKQVTSTTEIQASVDTKPASLQTVKEKLKFMKRAQIAEGQKSEATAADNILNTSTETKQSIPVATSNNIESEIDSESPVSIRKVSSAAGTVSYSDYALVFSRCRHFERLAQSLERRIEIMQEEQRNYKIYGKGETQSETRTIEFAEAKEITSQGQFSSTRNSVSSSSSLVSNLPNRNDTTNNSSGVADLSAIERQAKDSKTIRELAAEVKRLTTLLSRQMIEEEESINSSQQQISAPSKKDSDDAIPSPKLSNNTLLVEGENIASVVKQTTVVVQGYSTLFVICVFLIGILVVLGPLVLRHPDVSLW